MSNVDAAPEPLAVLSSPPLEVELDVEVDVVELPELLDVCATEVTPGPVENAGGLSVPQASARAAARARRRMAERL